jgi:hypothetical protein
MAARRPTYVILLLLLSLDFATPYLGGAFTFEGSGEGLCHRRESAVAPLAAPLSIPKPAAGLLSVATTPTVDFRPRASHEPIGCVLALPRAQARIDPRHAPSDDH